MYGGLRGVSAGLGASGNLEKSDDLGLKAPGNDFYLPNSTGTYVARQALSRIWLWFQRAQQTDATLAIW